MPHYPRRPTMSRWPAEMRNPSRAHRDLEAGNVVSHEHVLREFGVRWNSPGLSPRAQLRGVDRESAVRILLVLTRYGESGEGDVKALSECEGHFGLLAGSAGRPDMSGRANCRMRT